MIRRKDEIKEEILENFKGGEGYIKLYQFLSEEKSNGMGRLFAKCIIPPGSSIGEHRHEGDMENYYILKGKALINDNGTKYELGPGDNHTCFDGDFHSIKSIGDEDLEYIPLILFTKQKI